MSEENKRIQIIKKTRIGMRISADGLLGRLSRGGKLDEGGRFMLGELLDNIREMADKFYDDSDDTIVDQFCKLWSVDRKRPNIEE